MDTDTLLALLGYVVGLAVALVALYFIIKSAVLAALREHTLSSTTAVSVTTVSDAAAAALAKPHEPQQSA
ncbi:hypothetical protein ALI44B_04625 [Leifsonia sp. ALI-44-B]|uniref:hypothetical protein n=1 Tax=Leifsonia sp. ALI-44-B TaxID=1933776 RepID=UPI00097C8B7A|nr:hypothetical protein [Leifsonia sp. ALI-44-B]ONI63915.1 hypothetical protein ALI44B_04625 [Leifsonia sp. ALI-44-B]